MAILSTKKTNHLEQPLFFGENVSIARYDRVKYPWVNKLDEKINSFHWLPAGRDLTKDAPDFKTLTEAEQHIFISNLKRQILLDTIQGRAITEAFMPIASVPELEPLFVSWEFFETIHSKTYTHIIRNVFPDPSIIFDDIMENKQILKTAGNLTKYYDQYIEKLIEWRSKYDTDYSDNGTNSQMLYDLKKAFFLCLYSVNILEGVRFYSSFACSFAFGEKSKMEGNAGLIKLICR